MSLAKRVHLVLHMCTTRYSTSSMTVVQDDDYAAGLYRDQDDTPGGRARPAKHSRPAGSAARVQENHNIACTPSSVRVRSRLGMGCSVARRAVELLQLQLGARPTVRAVHRTSLGDGA